MGFTHYQCNKIPTIVITTFFNGHPLRTYLQNKHPYLREKLLRDTVIVTEISFCKPVLFEILHQRKAIVDELVN